MDSNDMKTSEQWWVDVKSDETKLHAWLKKQLVGEREAAHRITVMRDSFTRPGTSDYKTLTIIAKQEAKHAEWVSELLKRRGLPEEAGAATHRYWDATLPGVTSLHNGAAVGAHAEKMRLDRIRVIAEDPTAPPDIREVFTKILHEEIFHERAFREMSTPEAMLATMDAHMSGKNALGLVA